MAWKALIQKWSRYLSGILNPPIQFFPFPTLLRFSRKITPCWLSLSAFPLILTPKYLTIIPRTRVGYEMIDSQRGA